MAVKDYNVDPDLNTTISGINIAEGCAPSGINNAIRQLMADVKEASEEQTSKDAEQDADIAAAQSSADAAQSSVDAVQESVYSLDTALRTLIAQEVAKRISRYGDNMEGALKFGNLGAVYHDYNSASESLNIGLVEEIVGRSAILSLRSSRATDTPGSFWIGARNAYGGRYLVGSVDGPLSWGNERVLTSGGVWTQNVSGGQFTVPAGGAWSCFIFGRTGTTTWLSADTVAGGTFINTGMAEVSVIGIRVA